jgi:hypothetical protein
MILHNSKLIRRFIDLLFIALHFSDTSKTAYFRAGMGKGAIPSENETALFKGSNRVP